VTCADSPVSSANSRSIPTPACDTTPWPSADTRETVAILFTCEVPSCRHCGTVEKSHYALQDRHFRFEGSFFEVEVGEQVDARGLDALVAEPERDYAGVNAGFQEPHGGGVSQYVCGDLLFADARALTGGAGNVG
jgi:hypothetical protein